VVQRCKLVEARRAIETSQFHGDIYSLKKKVTDFEQTIKKLKVMVDEERTDDLTRMLSDNQQEAELVGLLQEIQKVEAEVRDAKKFNPANLD
jgi:hypothetical protein